MGNASSAACTKGCTPSSTPRVLAPRMPSLACLQTGVAANNDSSTEVRVNDQTPEHVALTYPHGLQRPSPEEVPSSTFAKAMVRAPCSARSSSSASLAVVHELAPSAGHRSLNRMASVGVMRGCAIVDKTEEDLARENAARSRSTPPDGRAPTWRSAPPASALCEDGDSAHLSPRESSPWAQQIENEGQAEEKDNGESWSIRISDASGGVPQHFNVHTSRSETASPETTGEIGCEVSSSDVESFAAAHAEAVAVAGAAATITAATVVSSEDQGSLRSGGGRSVAASLRDRTLPIESPRTLEILALRDQLDREVLCRRSLEESHQEIVGREALHVARLHEQEARNAELSCELREAQFIGETLRRQLDEAATECSEVQDQLGSEKAKAENSVLEQQAELQADLQAQAEKAVVQKQAGDLREQVRQLEEEVYLAAGAPPAEWPVSVGTCGDLATQVGEIRKRLEETARLVRAELPLVALVRNCWPAPSSTSVSVSNAVSPLALDNEEQEPEEELPGVTEVMTPITPTRRLRDPFADTDGSGRGTPTPPGRPPVRVVSRGGSTATGVSTVPTGTVSKDGGFNIRLSMRDLSEIKALKRPPPPLRMLLEVLCLMFGIPPTKTGSALTPAALAENRNKGSPSPRTSARKRGSTSAAGDGLDYWEPARRYLLSDPFLPSKLRDYDPDQLSQAQRLKILRYLLEPDFTADRVKNCSKAAGELYNWVRSMTNRPGFAPSAPPSRPRSRSPSEC